MAADFPVVLFDGWPLAYQPESASALHVLDLLHALPEGASPVVALPAHSALSFPPAVNQIHIPAKDSPVGRLKWEQVILPSAARKCKASLLHLTGVNAPIQKSVPCLVSPAEHMLTGTPPKGVFERLRTALGRAGLDQDCSLLWPADLPAPSVSMRVVNLPPLQPGWFNAADLLPGRSSLSVYCHFPLNDQAVALAADTLLWALPALDEALVISLGGVPDRWVKTFREACRARDIPLTIDARSFANPGARRSALQDAGACLYLGQPVPWADVMSLALACGIPLVAEENPGTDARAGSAGYLTPPGDARVLAGGLLTLLVEESVSESLSRAAKQRAAQWQPQDFRARLVSIYRELSARIV
jgi:hypothetical protein